MAVIKRVTMQDIADACGLSRNTVSKIFNGRGSVPDSTRDFVLSKAQELGYWLKKYEGHIGVGQCSCRASRGVMGEGCADDPSSWCIGCGVCTTKCMFDAIHLKRDHPECTDMRRAEDKIKVVASMAVKRLGEDISYLFKKKG